MEWDGSEIETEMADVSMDDTMLMLAEGSSNWNNNRQSNVRDLMVFSGGIVNSAPDSPATEVTPTGSVLALPPAVSGPLADMSALVPLNSRLTFSKCNFNKMISVYKLVSNFSVLQLLMPK